MRLMLETSCCDTTPEKSQKRDTNPMMVTLYFLMFVMCILPWSTHAAGPAQAGANFGERSLMYKDDSANVSRLLDDLLRGYDKRLRPNYNGGPVEVGVTMFVDGVSSVSEVNMDYTLDFYIRQFWQDRRLAFSPSMDEISISNEMLERIWWPDTFFANAKSARFHAATTRNAFIRISPTGFITLSLRLSVTAACPMDLTLFPMDSQICSLEMESYAYSAKHIVYKWKQGVDRSVTMSNVHLPQFDVERHRIRETLELLSTGNYSRLTCEFFFVRRLGYYIINIYVPSSLIVVLSWVSFWLHRDAAAARIFLGITTVTTMTTLISSTNASLPKISYLKSIDVYLVTCFFMVFAAMLEYAAVSYISNRAPQVVGNLADEGGPDGKLTSGTVLPYRNAKESGSSCNSRIADAIDKFSRLIFPVVFAILSAIYWISYVAIGSRT